MIKSTLPTQGMPSAQLSNKTILISPPLKRLIVLIPESYFNPSELAERIWNLSFSNYSQVILMGVYSNPSMELILRRQLVTLAASIRDNNMSVEIILETGKYLNKSVEQIWKPGDTVVGLTQKSGGRYPQEMNKILQLKSHIPVHVISDLHLELYKNRSILKEVSLWLGAGAIMVVFFWIQIIISRLPGNWGQSVLYFLSVFAEIGILWAWNLMLG